MALNFKLDLKSIDFEKLLDLPLKIKIYVVAGVVVVIWGLYAGFAAYPKYKSITNLKTEFATLSEKRDQKKRDAANLPKLKQEVQLLEKELRYSMTVLPNSEEIPSLVNAVENLLRKFNLDILSFRPENEVKRDFYAEIPISLRFSGEYRNIGDFCQSIARYPRIINITNINLRDPRQKDSKFYLNVETKATTYRFLKPEEMPKPEVKSGKK